MEQELLNLLEGGASALGANVTIKSNLLPDIVITAPSSSGGSPLYQVGSLFLAAVRPAIYVGAAGQEVEVAAPFGEPIPGLYVIGLIVIVLVWLISLAVAVKVLA